MANLLRKLGDYLAGKRHNETMSANNNKGPASRPGSRTKFPGHGQELEKEHLEIAYIPIICAAPLLYAKSHGHFAANGLDVQLQAAPGWSGVKDLLAYGHTDAAHLLSPMPLAVQQGLDGKPADMHLAAIQNINGQALTLASKYQDLSDVRDMRGFTFAVPYHFSMHYYLLCLYLAEHGLNPLQDVKIIEVPPPRMPHFLATNRVDGLFAPEPFNQIPAYRGTGFIYTLSKNIWPGHPCCCFATTSEFIEKNPITYRAMLKSVVQAELDLHQAGSKDRREIARELSAPGILSQDDPEPVCQALSGEYDDGRGRQCVERQRIDFMPTPWVEYGQWILSQQQRWGQLRRLVDYREVVESCFERQAREIAAAIGFQEPKASLDGVRPFQGTNAFEYMQAQPFSSFQESPFESQTKGMLERIQDLNGLLAAAAGGKKVKEKGPEVVYDDLGALEQLVMDLIKNNRFNQDQLQEHNETLEAQIKARVKELEDIKLNLEEKTSELEQSKKKLEKQSQIKSAQMDLNAAMSGTQELAELSRNIVTFLAKYLKADIGAFYVLTENEKIRLTGSYAFNIRKHAGNEFEIGEGIVGQAALEKERILLTQVPRNYLAVRSGLGESTVQEIVVKPFLRESKVRGLLELGSLSPFSQEALEFLDLVEDSVALGIQTIKSHHRVQELLEESQTQTEELQTQQEELRQTNEELEKQTRALKESEESLQTQQEELRATNEELEEKARLLEKQKESIDQKNRELEQARKESEQRARDLEAASRYKSEFLANMSHELRTPLNSILLLSKYLAENKEGNLSTRQVESASTVHSSGNDLLGLINEVLDLAKVESGKMILKPEELDIQDMVMGLEKSFKPLAEEKGLALNMLVLDGVPERIGF